MNKKISDKIGVIIPVKDRHQQLLRALKSINEQSLVPHIVIIIDDNSKKIINIQEKYLFKLKIIRNEKNMGPSYSRNLGIKNSKSKYIAFLDSDDYWRKHKIKIQYNIAKIYNADLVASNFTGEEQKISFLKNNLILKKLMNLWSHPNSSSMLMKRRTLMKIKGFDNKLRASEDQDLWFRLSISNFKLIGIKDNLTVIEKYNPQQISRNFFCRINSLKYFLKKYKNLIIKNSNLNHFNNFSKELYARAMIPVLKKSLLEFNLINLFKIIKFIIFSKIFYKRLFSYKFNY
jgi:glycosyltransferase involved in cell wall biosynthesis